MIGCGFDGFGRVGRVLHAEGLEAVLDARTAVPVGSARGLRHDATCQEMGDVGIGEGRAEARHRLDIAQGPDQRRLIEAEQAERIVGIGRQPGPLSEQVEDAELAGHPRVLQLEVRIEIDDAVVPAELLAVDHDRQGRGEKGLGGRADLEDRLGVDRLAAALLRTPKPLA